MHLYATSKESCFTCKWVTVGVIDDKPIGGLIHKIVFNLFFWCDVINPQWHFFFQGKWNYQIVNVWSGIVRYSPTESNEHPPLSRKLRCLNMFGWVCLKLCFPRIWMRISVSSMSPEKKGHVLSKNHAGHPDCHPWAEDQDGHLQDPRGRDGNTGWWFGTCFVFLYIGKNHPNWLVNIFQRCWNHQPE